ncbi:MAG: chemotaxis protein CheW [Oligoflexia bacterium]|nr:chemotaxis protein CheW [Oligoflexia bacterium]
MSETRKKAGRGGARVDWGRESESRYLIFRLGEELYGTPILGVREVLEPQAVKPIPNAVKYFAGVINVRGEIVGMIDLRVRFGHEKVSPPTLAFVIFDSAVGPIGAIVDKVEVVTDLGEDDIERHPKVETEVPSDFLIGIGKFNDRLVSLIDFNKVLGAEDLRHLRSSRLGPVGDGS